MHEVVHPQLGGEPGEALGQLRLRARWVGDAHRLADDGHVRDVGVGVDRALAAQVQIGRQHRVHEGDVHPLQQPRVLRGVRPTIRGGALNAPVHHTHGIDGLLGQLGGAVRGGREVGPGALQPAEGVLAVGGVTVHPGHGQRVQGLQVEAADAADERGHRAMDGPDRIAWGEPPGGAGRLGDRPGDVGLAVGPPGQHLAHGRGQRGQEGAGCHGSRVRQPAPARIRAVGPVGSAPHDCSRATMEA